jgi:hypothetical protein
MIWNVRVSTARTTSTALDPCLTHINRNNGMTQYTSQSHTAVSTPFEAVALLTVYERIMAQRYSEIEIADADSIPFVAVTLLTPTEGMTGGETVLKKGDGSEMSVGFPQAGYLLVLQVYHCLVNAF